MQADINPINQYVSQPILLTPAHQIADEDVLGDAFFGWDLVSAWVPALDVGPDL